MYFRASVTELLMCDSHQPLDEAMRLIMSWAVLPFSKLIKKNGYFDPENIYFLDNENI